MFTKYVFASVMIVVVLPASLAVAQPPANDACPGFSITSVPYADSGSTAAATNNYSMTCGANWGPDVVYTLQLSACYLVSVSLCAGSNYDTQLFVRTGGVCPGTTMVACNNNACGQQSYLSFQATADVAYYIVVNGNSAFGSYTLNVTGFQLPPSDKDTCPGRLITSFPYNSGTDTLLECAQTDYDYNCGAASTLDHVYRWTPFSCGTLTASLCSGTNFNTQLFVRTGGSCPGDSLIACNDNSCGQASQVTLFVEDQREYYFIIANNGSSVGNYVFQLTGTLAAIRGVCVPIDSLPFVSTDSLTCGVQNYTPTCTGGGNTPDFIYRYVSPYCQRVTASLCGSEFNTVLQVRRTTQCPGSPSTIIACNDDFCGTGSQVEFFAQQDSQYVIIVQGAGEVGTFTLYVAGEQNARPCNDACPGLGISALPYSHTDTITYAADDFANCGAAKEVVYQYIAQCSHALDLSVTPSHAGDYGSTFFEVRRNGPCPGVDSVFCGQPSAAQNPDFSFTAQPGETTYVAVSQYSLPPNHTVTFDLSGAPIPPPSDTCGGVLITSLPFSDFQGTSCGVTDDFDYSCSGSGGSPDLIYSLQLPVCHTVTASLCGSSFGTNLMVRTDGACPGTSEVVCGAGCDFYNPVTFFAYAEQVYYLIPEGYNGQSGLLNVNITGAPIPQPADTCPGIAITSLPYIDSGDTRCAFSQYSGCVSPLSREMVYALTLDSCQAVTASLCGSTYDCAVEVRTNGSCPGDDYVRCNDDNYCDSVYTLQSTVTWIALAGQTYYLLVHGSFTEAGNYVLNLTGAPCPEPELVNDLVIRALVPGNNARLHWNPAVNADYYNIYRGEQSSFPMDEAHLIGTSQDTTFLDIGALSDVRHFYVITSAIDVVDYGLAVDLPPKGEAVMAKADPGLIYDIKMPFSGPED